MEEKKQNFITLLRRSVYAPEFYTELLSKPFTFSLKYFFLLALLATFVYTATFAIRFGTSITTFSQQVGPAIVENWPQDLEVIIKDGKASTNTDKPYFIPFPKEFDSSESALPEGAEKRIEYFLVVDTSQPFDLERFNSYNTLFLLTERTIIAASGEGVRIASLAEFPSMTVNKVSVDNFVATYIEPFAKFAMPVLVGGTFLLMFASQTASLAYLLLVALLVWAIAKIKKLPIGYKKAYQFSLHAATTGKLANVFLLGFLDARIPFLLMILTLITAWFNMKPASPSESRVAGQPATPAA